MIRAAAKNHSHVAVVVDPNDYDELLQHLSGSSSAKEALQYRKRLAWKAFQHCATYDSTVAEWLWSQIGKPCPKCANFILCKKGRNLHIWACWWLASDPRTICNLHCTCCAYIAFTASSQTCSISHQSKPSPSKCSKASNCQQ